MVGILTKYYLLCELLQLTGSQNVLRYATNRRRGEINNRLTYELIAEVTDLYMNLSIRTSRKQEFFIDILMIICDEQKVTLKLTKKMTSLMLGAEQTENMNVEAGGFDARMNKYGF